MPSPTQNANADSAKPKLDKQPGPISPQQRLLGPGAFPLNDYQKDMKVPTLGTEFEWRGEFQKK